MSSSKESNKYYAEKNRTAAIKLNEQLRRKEEEEAFKEEHTKLKKELDEILQEKNLIYCSLLFWFIYYLSDLPKPLSVPRNKRYAVS